MTKQTVEERIKAIEKRNAVVEKNKAWETSFVRRASISIFTYIVAGIFLELANLTREPWLNALVPVGGYMLSTLSLNFIRTKWEARR